MAPAHAGGVYLVFISDGAEPKTATDLTEPLPTDDEPTEGAQELLTRAEIVAEVQQPLPAKYCGDQLAACVAGCTWQAEMVLCHAICILAYQGCLRL